MKIDERNIRLVDESADIVRITQEDIRVIIGRIVGSVDPEKIYLFGSRARGDHHEYSDLDLLVVMNTDEPDKRKRGVEISWLTRGRGFPMDVIVYTPEEFTEAVNHEDYWFNPLIKDILKDGILLYNKNS